MDYPENPSIIDPMEDQSDYYDRSKAVFFVCVVYFGITNLVESLVFHILVLHLT